MAVGLEASNSLLAKALRVAGGPEMAMLLAEVALM